MGPIQVLMPLVLLSIKFKKSLKLERVATIILRTDRDHAWSIKLEGAQRHVLGKLMKQITEKTLKMLSQF